ncbi:hypothetical protein QTP86_021661, partial [Hemibagrus guttatus]
MVDEPVFKVPNKRKKQDILILGGDFNCTTDDLDRNHAEPHVASLKHLWEVMETHELNDIWKTFNKNKRQYTWAHAIDNSLSLARLDCFYGFRKQTVSFYSKLYSSEWSGAQVVEDSFLVDLPKLSERAARELDRELTLEELHEALQRMENGRASGIDGLPAEFYKAFWAVIGQDVLDVLWDSVRGGQLPLSCRRAVLTLLPKKGDLTHLKNWRPVSLLCTDYKLLSKALASRLTKKQNKGCRTLHWLLEEPLVYGGRLDISSVTVPALSRTLISSGIVTLRELVNIAWSDLSRAEDLALRMGQRGDGLW